MHEIYLPVQSSTWRFDADAVASYTITVTCDDGKTGGTATRTSIIGLTPNVAPSITNIPGRYFLGVFITLRHSHSAWELHIVSVCVANSAIVQL